MNVVHMLRQGASGDSGVPIMADEPGPTGRGHRQSQAASTSRTIRTSSQGRRKDLDIRSSPETLVADDVPTDHQAGRVSAKALGKTTVPAAIVAAAIRVLQRLNRILVFGDGTDQDGAGGPATEAPVMSVPADHDIRSDSDWDKCIGFLSKNCCMMRRRVSGVASQARSMQLSRGMNHTCIDIDQSPNEQDAITLRSFALVLQLLDGRSVPEQSHVDERHVLCLEVVPSDAIDWRRALVQTAAAMPALGMGAGGRDKLYPHLSSNYVGISRRFVAECIAASETTQVIHEAQADPGGVPPAPGG